MNFKKISEEKTLLSKFLPIFKIALPIVFLISSLLELLTIDDLILEYQVNYPDIYEDCVYYGMLLFVYVISFISCFLFVPEFIRGLKENNSIDKKSLENGCEN